MFGTTEDDAMENALARAAGRISTIGAERRDTATFLLGELLAEVIAANTADEAHRACVDALVRYLTYAAEANR